MPQLRILPLLLLAASLAAPAQTALKPHTLTSRAARASPSRCPPPSTSTSPPGPAPRPLHGPVARRPHLRHRHVQPRRQHPRQPSTSSTAGIPTTHTFTHVTPTSTTCATPTTSPSRPTPPRISPGSTSRSPTASSATSTTPATTLPPARREVLARFPDYGLNYKYGGWHLTRTIAFATLHGRTRLYVTVGSSCDYCRENEVIRATLSVMDPDGTQPADPRARPAQRRRHARSCPTSTAALSSPPTWATTISATSPRRHLLRARLQLPSRARPHQLRLAHLLLRTRHRPPRPGRLRTPISTSTSSRRVGPTPPQFDCTRVPAAYTTFIPHSSPLGLAFFDTSNRLLTNTFLVALHGAGKPHIGTGYRVVRFTPASRHPQNFLLGFLVNGKVTGPPLRHPPNRPRHLPRHRRRQRSHLLHPSQTLTPQPSTQHVIPHLLLHFHSAAQRRNLLLLFARGTTARVPHSSRPHRDEWECKLYPTAPGATHARVPHPYVHFADGWGSNPSPATEPPAPSPRQ